MLTWYSRTILVVALLCASSSPVKADSIWWFGDESHRWLDAFNWRLQSAHSNALPMELQHTYITTSQHAGLDLPLLPVSIVESGDVATTGQLYVGGWESSLDAHHGDPHGRHGSLDITGGELTVSWNPGGSAPPCDYVRVGYRGATGQIRQSGGKLYTCTFMTLGFWSRESVGTFELSGGTFETHGLDIGNQGVGVFKMSGGEVTSLQDFLPGGAAPAGQTNVGRAYFHPDTGFIPGAGFMHQSGGDFTADRLVVGLNPGSAGLITVRGPDSSIHAGDRIYIGEGGAGALVQTGGAVRTPAIYLGRLSGGSGSYTISGGRLTQIGSGASTGFFNGPSNPNHTGVGSFTIAGTETPVNGGVFIAGRYDQSSRSRLAFLFDDTTSRVSRMWVGGTATFASGALVSITSVDSTISATNGEVINLMIADTIVDNGLVLENSDDWSITILRDVPFFLATKDIMQAVYCPGC